MGGFECTYAHIHHEKQLDVLAATEHDKKCREDYQRLKAEGILTVREGLAWSHIDQGQRTYDFSRFEPMMQIAAEEGVQQIWDLNHFDYPAHAEPFAPEFSRYFADYARECIKVIRRYQSGTIYIVPINEISFWAHMGAMIGVWNPYKLTQGYGFKQTLVKASIAAMEAIWAEDKDVRFIQVDPLFYRKAKDPPSTVMQAIEDAFREIKFQAFDMLSGRLNPELGGHPKYLDLIGGNYYPYNQEWITGDDWLDENCHETIPYQSRQRISFADIIQEAFDRYERPIILTELGAWGDLRVPWWRRTLREIDEAINRGLPVAGVCAYPVIDRPDWDKNHLTQSGFWDFPKTGSSTRRIPYEPILELVRPYVKKWAKWSNQEIALAQAT